MASSFALMFDEIFRRELTAVLSRVAEGEGLVLETLVTKYLPVDVVTTTKAAAAPKKKRAAKVSTNPEPTEAASVSTKCTSTTAKGKQCTLNAVEGECMCRIHIKAAKKPAAPTPRVPRAPANSSKPTRKPKKVKKTEQPTHTHELDDGTHDDCELCQTHGSAMADTDEDEEFEMVSSPPRTIRERLANIVKTQEYEDEGEEDD